MHILTAMLALAACGGTTGAECVVVADKDVHTLPVSVRNYIRYLTLGEVPQADRDEKAKVLSGHVNHLSTEQDLQPVAVVDGCDGAVLRIDIRDYGWSVELWERLIIEPYFHVDAVEQWPGGVWAADGKNYPAGPYTIRALAPWLSEAPSSPKTLASLATATNSQVPIVRGDWFLNQSAVQKFRKVGYFDFLRIRTQADFDALAGFDRKIADKAGRVDREAVSRSGVGPQSRGFAREEGVRPKWSSFDFEQAVDDRDPLEVIGKDIEKKIDATEQYALMKNGLWATFLANGKGERQDSAPSFVASDSASKSNDKNVHINMSCQRCHTDGGLQTIKGWFRHGGGRGLKSTDEEKGRKFRQEYLSNLNRLMDRDRAVYADAIKECTGWTTKEWASAYASEWERYEDASVDLEWAARDLHTTPEVIRTRVALARKVGLVVREVKQDGDVLNVKAIAAVSRVFGPLVDGEVIDIRHWEKQFQSAAATVRGLVP